MDLRRTFGAIDIYLFDRLLRGLLRPGMSVLDAGCGEGRNLVYLLNSGFDVHAADRSAGSIERVRRMASELAPDLPPTNFRVEAVESLSFPDASFDAVLSIAVLHFAEDRAHFDRMMRRMWDLLRPGGSLFIRVASSIGIEERITPLGNGHFALPDGTERFLVDERIIQETIHALDAAVEEPVKTVNVGHLRAMTTLTLIKP